MTGASRPALHPDPEPTVPLSRHQADTDAATRCGIKLGMNRCRTTHAAIYSDGYEAASRLFWAGLGCGLVGGVGVAMVVAWWAGR